MKRSIAVAAAVSLAALTHAAVTVGPDWCVVYPESGSKDVNRVLRIAAEEVCDDINEATGLSLKTVPASKARRPAIWIGAAFAEKAGFDLSGFKWYDNAIAEKDGSIYLFGNDRPGRDAAKYGRDIEWFRCVLPSVKAATRFLETAAGVRFLMPGEVGKEVPRRKEISIADGSFSVERPSTFFGSAHSETDRSLIHWIANGEWGMGAFQTYAGHTYPSACPGDRYFKTHPEYFAMKNGKRTLGATGNQTALCISNPEVEELIVDELKKHFDMGADACQLAQHDGLTVCECDKCRAMYGTGDDWGEKFWLFHRHIAERILKERPGKVVHILSYAATAHPPKTFKVFPDNVMIEMCRYSDKAFQEWQGYTVPRGFTVYTYLAGTFVMPGFVARHSFAHLAQLAKRFRDNNALGVFSTGPNGDLFGTEGPGYYIYRRLILDGSLNVSALLADYCSAAFGPAAPLMRKFYDAQDARLRMYDKIAEGFPSESAAGLEGYVDARPKSPLDLHGWMFSPDTTAQMEECLSRAEKAAGLTAKHRKRLELVRLEFDYAKMMGNISTLYAAYKLNRTREALDPLAKVLERRNAWLDRTFDANGKPKRLDGWPEIPPFGENCTRKLMNVNGRLSAPIGVPLTWPVEMLKHTLPGSSIKKADAVRTETPPTFAAFEADSGWQDIGGISMEIVPVKARFKVQYDGSCLYLLVESDLADDVEVKCFPHDGAVWTDDCMDMMIAPGDTRDIHYHFIWNVDPSSRYDDATGLVKDTLDPDYGKAVSDWNAKGWKTVSRRGGGKWRTIATFPYSDFCVAAPKPGDTWFINVGHIAMTGAKRKESILMLWSPNLESRLMIAPNAMGKLIFK